MKKNSSQKHLLISAIHAAIAAGDKIMEIYSTSFDVEEKEDHSPLTAADKAAHELICAQLEQFEFPILSEEGRGMDYEERKAWEYYWCVDPLDGTKEFIKRNGEFTVNIAFMNKQSPEFGVIYQPANGELFAGFEKQIYFLTKETSNDLVENNLDKFIISPERRNSTNEIKVVASRSHLSKETEQFINGLKSDGKKVTLVNSGSALKFCLLAAEKANVYPRFAPTMEWDTAAGHAILKACGKNIYLWPSKVEMTYNKITLVNDWFIAE